MQNTLNGSGYRFMMGGSTSGRDVYANDDLDCICLECIHNGKAAEKFDASFVQYAEPVSDPQKTEELFQRTSGYMSWQGEIWLSCCDDYCEYLGPVGIEELDKLGIKDQVLNDYMKHWPDDPIDDINEYLFKDGYLTGPRMRLSDLKSWRTPERKSIASSVTPCAVWRVSSSTSKALPH